jgi:hypothetical protein
MHFLPWVCNITHVLSPRTENPVDQAQTVSRRVEKFAELMQSVWVSRNDYERRARAVCPLRPVGVPFLYTPLGLVALRPRRDARGVGRYQI